MEWLSGKEGDSASPFRTQLSLLVWRPLPFMYFGIAGSSLQCGRQHGLLAAFEGEEETGRPPCRGSDVLRKL